MFRWALICTVGCGFESRCTRLNFRYRTCFEQGVPWHSGNYRVCIHSETRTWRNENIQSDSFNLKTHEWQFWGEPLVTIDDIIISIFSKNSVSNIFIYFNPLWKSLIGHQKSRKNHTLIIYYSKNIANEKVNKLLTNNMLSNLKSKMKLRCFQKYLKL